MEREKVIEELKAEISKQEDQILGIEKSILANKTLIAALLCGFGVGDTVTDGNVVFLVNSFSGSFWKGFRKKLNGEYSDNEEYIKGDFMKQETPINIINEP